MVMNSFLFHTLSVWFVKLRCFSLQCCRAGSERFSRVGSGSNSTRIRNHFFNLSRLYIDYNDFHIDRKKLNVKLDLMRLQPFFLKVGSATGSGQPYFSVHFCRAGSNYYTFFRTRICAKFYSYSDRVKLYPLPQKSKESWIGSLWTPWQDSNSDTRDRIRMHSKTGGLTQR